MKITVITPFDSANFGAYLQAYCLKIFLEDAGHTVMHLPTRDAKYVRNLYYRDKPASKREKLFRIQFNAKKEYGKRKYKIFKQAQEFFNVINPDDDTADVHILGSDEIWNITQPAFRKTVFWGEGLSNVISYAASIGKASIEQFDQMPEHLNYLNDIKHCLVRDKRTANFVNHYTNKKAEIVCDPTMLIPVGEYGVEISDSYIKSNDCLLVYAYKLNKKQKTIIKQFASRNHLKIVSCCFYHDWCDYQCECSPLQFSSLIQQCKAVVTTTFHGSIFSMLNHAKFVSIPQSPKTTQLLKQFDMTDAIIENNSFSVASLTDKLLNSSLKYDEFEEKLAVIRKHSTSALSSAINDVVSSADSFSYQICPADSCTGCFACMNKCPKNAIHCVTDYLGRTVPKIDQSVCVKCGMCKKVCPVVNPVVLNDPIVCYAAQRREESLWKKSASGGIGAVLAETIIQNGGVVYGAVVENGKVIHKKAETIEEAIAFRGSKYVQSYIGNCYQEIQQYLKKEKTVLFIGTPCQVAGLKSFLGKDWDNLFCVDLVCHGTPPMKYLSEHLKNNRCPSAFDKMTFRCGESDYRLIVQKEDKIVYNMSRASDSYYEAFYRGLISRENCYNCVYATNKRVSDVTIGDFWGLNRDSLSKAMTGNISVILINTEKGKELYSLIINEITSEERQIDEAVQGNSQLRRPSVCDQKGNSFINNYIKLQDFDKTVKAVGLNRTMVKKRIKNNTKRVLRKIKQKIGR